MNGDSSDSCVAWEQASMWNKWTFQVANPMLRNGLAKVLQLEDLMPLSDHDRSQWMIDSLKSSYDTVRPVWFLPRLLVAMVRTFSAECAVVFFFTALEGAIRIAMPVILRLFLQSLISGTFQERFSWALILSALGIAQLVVHHILFFFSMRLGFNWKTAATGLIYDRLFMLKSSAIATQSTGKLVNLISNDTARFEEFSVFACFFVVSILELITILILLITQLNVASGFAGVGMTIIFIPIQIYLAEKFAAVRSKTAAFTDQRVRYTSEVIDGIATVKSYNWNNSFYRLIGSFRTLETSAIQSSQSLRSVNLGLYYFCVPLAEFATFSVFWGAGGRLTIPIVFSTISLLQVLRVSVALHWTRSIERGSEAIASSVRIEKFLDLVNLGLEKENECANTSTPKGRSEYLKVSKDDAMEGGIELVSAVPHELLPEELCRIEPSSYFYGENSSQPALQNIHFSVNRGELVIVCGPVGSGKSSLLGVVLGEISETPTSALAGTSTSTSMPSRHLQKNCKLAYCAQKAWILAASVRCNVTLAGRYDGSFKIPKNIDEELYRQSLESCCIVDDLENWPAYDDTEVGERGISVSGGQKARIALARVVYSDSSLCLLDDPLSACDAHVGKALFFDCILSALKDRAKGVLLATHQLQYLKYADKVIVLDEHGRQSFYGTYSELVSRATEFPDLGLTGVSGTISSSHSSESLQLDTNPNSETFSSSSPIVESKEMPVGIKSPLSRSYSRGISTRYDNARRLFHAPSSPAFDRPTGSQANLIIQAEDRAVGSMTWDVLWQYLSAGGVMRGIWVFFVAFVSQGLLMVTDYWLRWWASESFGDQSDIKYVSVFGVLTALCVFFGFYRAKAWFRFTLKSSSSLHERSLWSVMHSPLQFFIANPTGRILNRFSRDQNQADELLPVTMFDFLQCSLFCLGGVVVACVSIPWLALLIPLMLYSFMVVRGKYIASSREIKRIESITRSPIYSDFSSTVDGLITLRAYQLRGKFTEEFLNQIDVNTRAWFSFLMASRWLGFRLDLMAAGLLICVSILAAGISQSLDVGLIGFALVYVFSLSGLFQWTVRQSAEVENQMTAVERLSTYANQLPPEPGYSTTLESYLTNGPNNAIASAKKYMEVQGDVKLCNLVVTYREDLNPVLRGINAHFHAGSKVGICGRTGSGKSSTILAMLRLNLITSGDILIDGESLLNMDLETSRSIISIIPQDPHLFSGTIRYNLDPFDQYSDEDLWAALKDAQIDSQVSKDPLGLQATVDEGGKNFSVGQRQLLSLARSILRKCRIVLMDEVTASIDYATDQAIQRTIRSSPYLRSATIITVAHRIRTIADSDIIVVISEGVVSEMGSPLELLTRDASLFNHLAMESGEFDDIFDLASRAEKKTIV